jgi:hypothetical protein
MGAGAARLARDPLRVSGAGGDLAVERHRGLEDDQRAPHAGVLAEGLVDEPRGLGDLAVHEGHLDALVAQDARPAARGLGGRVVGGDHHAGDARLDDRIRAGRGAPLVGAGLERHVHGGAGGVLLAGAERHPLGVGLAGGLGDALTDHSAVLDHHGPDDRVGARLPARPAGQFDGPQKVSRVALCGGCVGHSGAPRRAR